MITAALGVIHSPNAMGSEQIAGCGRLAPMDWPSGIFRREQALQQYGRARVEYWLQSGAWTRRFSGVYTSADMPADDPRLDIRLAVDALELVFTRPEIGTFILLSGDSDFSSLVLKLKEYGKYVIGVGIRESSSDLLIQNCDEYYSYNELAGLTKEGDVELKSHDPWELVIEAVKQMTAHNDVMRSDRLKQVMQEIDPTFDEKNYGFSRFSKFVSEAAS